jgi:hypothetical protein
VKELEPPMNADERRFKTKHLSALISVDQRLHMFSSQLLTVSAQLRLFVFAGSFRAATVRERFFSVRQEAIP